MRHAVVSAREVREDRHGQSGQNRQRREPARPAAGFAVRSTAKNVIHAPHHHERPGLC